MYGCGCERGQQLLLLVFLLLPEQRVVAVVILIDSSDYKNSAFVENRNTNKHLLVISENKIENVEIVAILSIHIWLKIKFTRKMVKFHWNVGTYICVYVHAHVYIYIYIYAYARTHTYIYSNIYICIYTVIHRQTVSFYQNSFFSVVRHVGRSKPGSKLIQLYDRLSLRPFGQQAYNV